MQRKFLALFAFLLFLGCFMPALAAEKILSSKDIVRFSERILIEKNEIVQGDVVAIGGSVDVAGTVNRNAIAVGGDVNILPGGKVLGDATAVGGKVTKQGILGGSETSIGPRIHWKSTTREERVDKSGKTTVVEKEEESPAENWGWKILRALGMIALVTLLAALFPKATDRVAFAAERAPWASFLWGVGVLVAIVPVAFLLIVSLIGIALIPFELLLVCAAALFGYVAMSVLVGRRLMVGFGGKAPWIAAPLLGAFLIQLIGLVPVLGWFVKLGLLLFGLGAIALSRFGSRESLSIQ
jgi:hypothetical protein